MKILFVLGGIHLAVLFVSFIICLFEKKKPPQKIFVSKEQDIRDQMEWERSLYKTMMDEKLKKDDVQTWSNNEIHNKIFSIKEKYNNDKLELREIEREYREDKRADKHTPIPMNISVINNRLLVMESDLRLLQDVLHLRNGR